MADIFETPFAFLMDPAQPRAAGARDPAGDLRRYFYAMTWEDQYIWGATAGMLRALYDRLYGSGGGDERGSLGAAALDDRARPPAR